MFTDCPACNRQFHIYAAQLSAAGGEVKCGYCGQQFNALQRLHDAPRPLPPVLSAEEFTSADAEPEFFIPDMPGEPPVPPVGPDTGSVNSEPGPDTGPESWPAPLHDQATDADNALLDTEQSAPAVTSEPDHFTEFEFSEEMLEEPEPRSGLLSRLLWAFGIILLLCAGALQVIWFNRDEVMSRYPQTRDWYRQVCQQLECEYIRNHDTSQIVLLNRDVRDHPRYRDSLLVNATMSNQSHTLQPFPVVQLNLYDTDGELIAYRQFSPAEYMDNSIDIQAGMQPDIPVHFVLEVLGKVEGAVSFEFEFL